MNFNEIFQKVIILISYWVLNSIKNRFGYRPRSPLKAAAEPEAIFGTISASWRNGASFFHGVDSCQIL